MRKEHRLTRICCEIGHCAIRPSMVEDITYVPMPQAGCTLTVMMDWIQSVAVVGGLSNTTGSAFCLGCLGESLNVGSRRIFNTVKARSTPRGVYGRLEAAGVRVSMDGSPVDGWTKRVRGRLWRTGEVRGILSSRPCQRPGLASRLAGFFRFYNEERIMRPWITSRRRRYAAAVANGNRRLRSKSTPTNCNRGQNRKQPCTAKPLKGCTSASRRDL